MCVRCDNASERHCFFTSACPPMLEGAVSSTTTMPSCSGRRVLCLKRAFFGTRAPECDELRVITC
eukprot:6196246-Pleurochrysis_carterae.AAC.1